MESILVLANIASLWLACSNPCSNGSVSQMDRKGGEKCLNPYSSEISVKLQKAIDSCFKLVLILVLTETFLNYDIICFCECQY